MVRVGRGPGANWRAGRGEIPIQPGGCRPADRRLATTAPEAATRHDDGLHLWHLRDPHRIVGVEVALLDTAVLHRASAIEQSRQPIDERAGVLPFDLRRIDGVARIGGCNDPMHLALVAVGSPDFGATAEAPG